MPGSTPRGIPYPIASDLIKQSGMPSKLASDLTALAIGVDTAISVEGQRVKSEAISAAALDASAKDASTVAKANDALATANSAFELASGASSDADNAVARVETLESAAGFGPSTPEDGTIADFILNKSTLTSKALSTEFVGRGEIRVNVNDYGAIGDGVTDDFMAIKAALAVTPAGGTLYFPSEHYFTAYKDPSLESNHLVIDKDGIKFEGKATLENFLIYVKGGYGEPVSLAADVAAGASSFSTATEHGLAAGDYLQMLSCVNAYTSDGGEWQLGSASPTDGTQPIARYSEIHQVAQATSATAITLIDEVVYPTHRASSTGLSFPIAGVAGSQVRKLSMVKNIQFSGLTFRNVTASNFRGIMARAAANLRFIKCHFETGSLPGALVKMTDSYNVRFIGCTSTRSLDVFSGSSWNTFFVGGGCHGVYFEGGDFAGEAQAIDFTPNNFTAAADIGGAPDSASSMSTVQFFGVYNAVFRGCSDAFTSHPATYMFEASGNVIDGGSVGIRARSRASILRGNTIHTGRGGIALSAFLSDSVVSGNTIVQKVSAKYAGYYTGIAYNATSSEIMSDNAVRNMLISGNSIKVTTTNPMNAAIMLTHYDPPLFPLTNATKVRASEITVEDNEIRKGSIVVEKWINNSVIKSNSFAGGSDREYYIMTLPDSAANNIVDNLFLDAAALPVQTGSITLTGHGYATTHRVALQKGVIGLSASSLANAGSVFGQSGVIWDALQVGNGGKLSAVRNAGPAALNLDAVATDNTSDVTVNVFGGNTTSGKKLLKVAGRTMSDDFQIGFGSRIHGGAGTPEGVVSAPLGSLYLRADGAAGTSLYVKQSGGTGNTGWVGK